MFGKAFIFLLFVTCKLSDRLAAQHAKYASIPASYDPRIPEKKGNLMHVWASSSKQSNLQSQNTTITLYIFSTDMRPLAHRNIRLGSIRSWNMDFQYTDSCYYANIYYNSDSLYHVLVKVADDGTVTDAGDRPELWTKKNAYRQLNKIYALEQHNNFLYSIRIENADTSGNSGENSILLEKERASAGVNFQKLIIKKVNLFTKEESQKTYASSFQRFVNPFIQVTDNDVFAYSFSEPAFKSARNNPYNGSFLFAAKLDTSLHTIGDEFEMIKIAGPLKHKDFAPYNIFSIDKKTFIVTRGWDPDERINYFPPAYNRFSGSFRLPVNIDPTNCFRITVLNDKNELLRDTIIENRSGDAPLRWANRFIVASDKKIDFFFTRQFRGSKNGMTHMYMNNEGKLTEEDIIVDDHYEYYLKAARKLTEGMLLVPFGKNDRVTGIMKMQYDIATP